MAAVDEMDEQKKNNGSMVQQSLLESSFYTRDEGVAAQVTSPRPTSPF